MAQAKRKLTLKLIEERIQQLPLLPAEVCELMSADTDTPEFYDKVTALAKSDPSLATRVLQIVNSAAAAPVHPITDIHQAIIHIGVNKTLKFIYFLSVVKVFTPVTANQKAIWQHSIETARFAEFIAMNMEDTAIDKGLAYTCGLLHDIGRLVLFELSSRAIDLVDTKGWDTPIELPEIENRMLGFTHADVGYIAIKKWGLPRVLMDIVLYHHHYDLYSNPKVSEDVTELITIVQFADFLSVLIEKNPDWPTWNKETLEKEITASCIQDDWPRINFPIKSLVEELPSLNAECQNSVKVLGLG